MWFLNLFHKLMYFIYLISNFNDLFGITMGIRGDMENRDEVKIHPATRNGDGGREEERCGDEEQKCTPYPHLTHFF